MKLWMNCGSTFEENVMPRDDVSITKHGLKIPVDVVGYDKFVRKIGKSERKFVRIFEPILLDNPGEDDLNA